MFSNTYYDVSGIDLIHHKMSESKINQKVNIKIFPSSDSWWDVGCPGDGGRSRVESGQGWKLDFHTGRASFPIRHAPSLRCSQRSATLLWAVF